MDFNSLLPDAFLLSLSAIVPSCPKSWTYLLTQIQGKYLLSLVEVSASCKLTATRSTPSELTNRGLTDVIRIILTLTRARFAMYNMITGRRSRHLAGQTKIEKLCEKRLRLMSIELCTRKSARSVNVHVLPFESSSGALKYTIRGFSWLRRHCTA